MYRIKNTCKYVLSCDKDGTLVVWPFEALDNIKIDNNSRWVRYKLPAIEPLTTVIPRDGKPTVEEFTGLANWDLPILTKQVIKVTSVTTMSSVTWSDPMPDDKENTMNQPIKMTMNDHKQYVNEDKSLVLQREFGMSPNGNPLNGKWVLRKTSNLQLIGFDKYRYNLAKANNLKLQD